MLRMYTHLPSIDSRLDAASARSSCNLEGAWREDFTVPLLSDYSPLPKAQAGATPIVLSVSSIRWAPLPVREPRMSYPQRKRIALRNYSPSETMTMMRKWYMKNTDADRLGYVGKIRGDRGTCHFCSDCGENHKRSKSKDIPQSGPAARRVRCQELDNRYS